MNTNVSTKDEQVREIVKQVKKKYANTLLDLSEPEELSDLRERFLKLNNGRFREELFKWGKLRDRDYLDTVFILRNYHYRKNDWLFNRTDKERVRRYKNNQQDTVSREDVCMLSFFKRRGVL